MTQSTRDPGPTLQRERRRQVRGLLLLALLVLAVTIARTGLHHIFTPGWWRLW